VDEDLINFVYSNKQNLSSKYIIPENNMAGITDKYEFANALDMMGLSGPRTMLLSDVGELPDQGGKYLYKGRRGIRLKNLMKSKGAVLESPSDLIRLRSSIKGRIEQSEVIVQARLENNQKVLSCCGLAIDGELYRVFQYVKLRQHPDEFGTGTYLKSIINENLTEMSSKILAHFSYTGIFEIEFVNVSDGTYQILEMNPRTWKSINYATDCGQNLCLAYCDYLLKGIVPEMNFEYQVGKYWVHLSTDIMMLVKNRQWPGYKKNMSFCVLDFKDPLPFFMEFLLMPFILLKV
jgi:predicted ATP-grasp superfamily ATP-dependent carboligase